MELQEKLNPFDQELIRPDYSIPEVPWELTPMKKDEYLPMEFAPAEFKRELTPLEKAMENGEIILQFAPEEYIEKHNTVLEAEK